MTGLARAARILLLALATLLVATGARAAFTLPPLEGHVVDTAGKLSPNELRQLDAKLDRVRRDTGFAIVAFLVGSLEGDEIDTVAYKAFNTWQVGDKGRDNGVLLVIAPAERRIRIETGKGVGGALTDLQSNDIIRRDIAPSLKEERFAQAIDRGTTAIARALVADSTNDPAAKRTRAPPAAEAAPSLLHTIGLGVGIVVFIVLLIVSPTFRTIVFYLLLFGRGGGRGGGGGGSGYGGGGGRSGGGGSSDSY